MPYDCVISACAVTLVSTLNGANFVRIGFIAFIEIELNDEKPM